MGEYDLHIGIYGEDTNFTSTMNKVREQVHRTAREVEKGGLTIEQTFDRIKQAAAYSIMGFSAAGFIKQVGQIRGEFQKLEVALNTMLGNADKANTLLEQLTKTAATTPFDLQGVANGAKQLLAYGIEAEKVNDTLIHLGDIAAGLSLPLNDLVYLYGTTMVQGRMFTRDLLQFQGRGIPIAEELAKVLGVTKDRVGELVTAGKVGAKEFNQAIMAMSSEGGKFAGLMEAQSKTITGQISNIQDAIDVMFNNIGKQSEGIINGSLSVVSSLIENYEKVGKVIMSLVGVYGTYKVATMTAIALQSLQTAGVGALTTAETIHYGWLVLCQRAQALLNKTMLANPYVLVATLVAGVTAALWNMKSMQDKVNDAQDEYNRKKEEAIAKEEEHKNKINELITIAGDESLSTDTRREALVVLMQKYPAVFEKYQTEIEMLQHIRDIKAEIAALDGKASITNPANEIANINKRIKELEGIHTDSFINSAGDRTYTGRNRTESEEAELIVLKKTRDKLNNQIKKDKGNSYLANLTGVSNADLQSQINERRNLLAKMKTEEKKYGQVRGGGAAGIYTASELEGQLKALEMEQKRRADIIKNGSTNFVSEATKAYKKEAKALKDLESLTDPKKRSKSKMTIDSKKVSEMNSDEFLAAIKKQQSAVDEAKKKVDAYNKAANGGSTKDTTKEQEKAHARSIAEELAYQDELRKVRREAEDAQADAKIAAIQNDAEREREERRVEHERTLRDIKLQENDIYQSIYEQRKKAYENSNSGKSYENTAAGAAGWQGVKGTLTDEEKRYYDERYKIITASLEKENAEYSRYIQQRYIEEAQAMHDFLNEYGSIEQQKYAISKEFDQKIAQEQNEWRKKSLEEQKKTALAQLDSRKLAESIDWSHAFKGIGNILKDLAEETLKQIEDYMKTADFKGLTAEAKKSYSDLRQQLIDAGGQKASNPFSSKTWDEIATLTKKYQDSVKALKASMEKEKEIREKLVKAESRLALDPTNVGLQSVVATYRKQLEDAGNATKELANTTNETKNDLNNKANSAAKGLKNFNTVVGQLTDGSLSGFVDGVSNVIASLTKKTSDDMNGLIGLLGEKVGGIVGAVLNIIDLLGDKPVEFFDALLDGIAKCVQAVIENIPQIIGSVVKGLGGIVGSVFSGIGNLVAGIFGGGEDWSAYDEALEKWGGILDSWQDNIKYERELMEKAYGVKAIEASQKALEAAQKAADAAKGIYEGWAGSGAGWFSYSNGHDVNEGVNWSLLYNYDKDLFNKVGQLQTWKFFYEEFVIASGDVSKLFELTWQQLEQLKNRAPQFWASIHSEAQKYLDQYIEAGKAAEETLKALNEQLTGTTKENVFDDFLNSLYDLADGVEDVTKNIAENWQKMVNRMVINNIIAKDFQDDLEGWYDELAKLNKERQGYDENRNAITPISDEEYQRRLKELQDLYNSYFKNAQDKIEEFTNMGIIKPIEEAAEEVDTTIKDMTDAISSAFSDLVGDPTQDIEEWGRNIRNALIRQFVETYVLGEEFQQRMKEWSEKFLALIQGGYSTSGRGMSKEVYEELLAEYNAELDQMAGEAAELAKTLMDRMGYYFGNDDNNPFSSLRDSFLDTLTNIEDDAEAFKKRLEEIMVKDLIEKQVLDVPITVNGMDFDSFNAYVEDWNKRYADAVKSGNQEAIDALIQELVEVRAMTVKAAEELRERLKEATNDTTFKEMADSWVSTLMDMSKTAEDWAQDVGKVMAEKIIKEMVVAKTMQPLLDDLQKAFDMALAAEGSSVQSVIAAVTPYLNELTAAFPQLQEIVKGIMDALGVNTSVASGFGDLRSTFVSTLTDMQTDAAAFGKNIAITMLQQMMDELVKKKYQSQLDAISEQWRKALDVGDTDAMERLRIEILKLYETMENDEAIKKFTDDILALTNEIQTPFDNMRDSFRSALMDMSKSAKDFTQEISQMIAEDFINEFVMGSAFDQKLAEWKKRYSEITKDGNLTEEQRLAQLKQLAGLISNERDALTEQTRNILNLLGLGQHEDQTATMNMAEAATYDQFELYLGMATSHLMVAEQTKGLVQQILTSLQTLGGVTSPQSNYGQQIFSRLGTTNEYLLAMKRMIAGISEKIDTTNSHLSKL